MYFDVTRVKTSPWRQYGGHSLARILQRPLRRLQLGQASKYSMHSGPQYSLHDSYTAAVVFYFALSTLNLSNYSTLPCKGASYGCQIGILRRASYCHERILLVTAGEVRSVSRGDCTQQHITVPYVLLVALDYAPGYTNCAVVF